MSCGRALCLTVPIRKLCSLSSAVKQVAACLRRVYLSPAESLHYLSEAQTLNDFCHVRLCAEIGQNNNRPACIVALFLFFPPCWTFTCICFICLFAWLCMLEATGKKRTSSVYRAHGISIILGIFQHSLILIGLAAIVSRSQARQQLVMPSGGNMSITKRVALFRRRGGDICKFTLKIQSGDN